MLHVKGLARPRPGQYLAQLLVADHRARGPRHEQLWPALPHQGQLIGGDVAFQPQLWNLGRKNVYGTDLADADAGDLVGGVDQAVEQVDGPVDPLDPLQEILEDAVPLARKAMPKCSACLELVIFVLIDPLTQKVIHHVRKVQGPRAVLPKEVVGDESILNEPHCPVAFRRN